MMTLPLRQSRPSNPPRLPRRPHPASAAGLAAALAAAILATTLAPPAAAQAPDSAAEAADTVRTPRSEPADTFLLPGVVVTATRVPLPREALPTPVTVLSRDALQARGVRTVAEALRSVPGAAIVRAGAEGAQTSLFLRGGESDYVKVLIDGVPVNDAGGAVDLTDLPLDQVERIEVVRGPASVLYGSDAVSGVVQIFTRRGIGEPVVEVTAMGGVGARRAGDGGYGLAEIDASLAGSSGPVSYTVGGRRSWTDGMYPYNSERGLGSGTLRLGYAPRPGTEASAFVRVTESESHFPTDGAGALVDDNAFIDRRLVTYGLEAGQRLGDRVEARLQLGRTERDQASIDRIDHEADTLGVFASRLESSLTRQVADLRVNLELPRTILTVGAALEHAQGDVAYDSESAFGPLAAAAEYDRGNRGYYGQLLSEPLDGLHITLGARIDHNDVFGTFETWRAGLSWRLHARTRVRGAYGTAFREPTFAESFGSGFGDRGSVALEPERSESWEVGVEQEVGSVARISAGWFDQTFHDLIQYTYATPTPDDPNYYNVGAASASGLELAAELGRGSLSATASYTWLRTRVLDPGLATDAGFVEGEALLRRPARSATLGGRWSHASGGLALTVTRVGEREDLDFGAGYPAPRVTLDPHTALDLAAEQTILVAGVAADLLLRVRNLLDADYEATRGFPGPGRVLRLGVRLRTDR